MGVPQVERAFTRIPEPLTSFVGRERELAALKHLLRPGAARARLITLTGPPGTGKTRLAVQASTELDESDFVDGVWFVSLASVRDPTLISQAIAHVLEVRESGSEPLVERLIGFLKRRSALLVLDNFEQILAGAPLVARLLEHCAQLSVVVTSRAPLRLYGEQEFGVAPLPLPDGAAEASADRPMQSDAVRLFVERARRVRPEFSLTAATVPAVAEICRRLDGLPLAMELAAARTRVLSPQALLTRLGDRLSLLSDGSQNRPAHQQTLRAALDWSYELLSPADQTLFRRLAIFVGGCTLASVASVCDADGDLHIDHLQGLTSLIEQSLLQVEAEPDGEPRFRILESIREYAWERLVSSPDLAAVRQRHARVFLALAQAAEGPLRGPDQTVCRDRLQREMPNLRLALRWSLDAGDLEPALRAAAALWLFWFVRGFLTEGRQWLQMLLAHPNASTSPEARARALFTAGMLAFYQRDHAAGRALHEEGLKLQRQIGDAAGIAAALFGLAQVAFDGGDLAAARQLHEQALAMRRELGEPWQIAFSAGNLGVVLHEQGDTLLARKLIEESLTIRRRLGDRRGTAGGLLMLARVVQEQGDYGLARALYREGLPIAREVDDRWAMGHMLAGLAGLALAEGRWSLALRLYSAAAVASQASEAELFPGWRERVYLHLERARKSLGPAAAAAAVARGELADIASLLAEALAEHEIEVAPTAELGTHGSADMPLTRREREVAGLIARGYTNREVATSLAITERTAATHVEHILDKLGVASRAQIAAWAALRLDAGDGERRYR